MKGQKGITLVALVITIIVMLILAGVTISIVVNGGLFERAEDAVDTSARGNINEAIELAGGEIQTVYHVDQTKTTPEETANSLAEEFKDSLVKSKRLKDSEVVVDANKITVTDTKNDSATRVITITVPPTDTTPLVQLGTWSDEVSGT